MNNVGKGIFTLGDVALYTGTPAPTLHNWFAGKNPLFMPEIEKSDHSFAVSFHNLVEVLVTRALKDGGASTQQIRRAVVSLRKELDTPVPFCHREIRTDGKSLFVRIARQNGDEELYNLFTRQTHFPRIMLQYLRGVAYDSTNLAARWEIAPGVAIDPAICFGHPTITGTRIRVDTLYDAWIAEDRKALLVADLYGVTVNNVHTAVNFGNQYLAAA